MNATAATESTDINEPIFVFGSRVGGEGPTDSSKIAARFHGAQTQCWDGHCGNSYAIPYLDQRGIALSGRIIADYVLTFLQYARENPALKFRVARFGCEPGIYNDLDMAPLFRAAPKNCVLPALWRRTLGQTDIARLFVHDPLIRLADAEWIEYLKQYLIINLPLWGAKKCELLTAVNARRVSAVPKAAELLNCAHREIRANSEYYGAEVDFASEMLGIWHATHMLSIMDMNHTALPRHFLLMDYAHRNGVGVDDLSAR